MRIHYLIAVAGLSAVLAVPAAAQTIKKVGDDIHHTLKKAGNGIKEGAKDVGDATHRTLKKAGNDTKGELGRTTGIHRVGGSVGEAAEDVSNTSKHIGRRAKHSLKRHSSRAHRHLKREGRKAKAELKPY